MQQRTLLDELDKSVDFVRSDKYSTIEIVEGFQRIHVVMLEALLPESTTSSFIRRVRSYLDIRDEVRFKLRRCHAKLNISETCRKRLALISFLDVATFIDSIVSSCLSLLEISISSTTIQVLNQKIPRPNLSFLHQ